MPHRIKIYSVLVLFTLGVLPKKYLDHLPLLLEGIYLLLEDCITEEELCGAELLEEFYYKNCEIAGM